jgi:hypothetical protein
MLDPQVLEAAMRRDDPVAVRDLLKDASESERVACAKALKAFLTGPAWQQPDLVMLMPQEFIDFHDSGYQDKPAAIRRQEEQQEERNRDYNAWREMARGFAFQLAALGLAGGVAAAAKLASEFGNWETTPAEVSQVAVVLADRRPPWLADFMDRHLKLHGEFQFGIAAWPLARALVRLGAIPRPSRPEYTTLMPGGTRWQAQTGDKANWPVHQRSSQNWPPPAEALLADSGLLEDEFWRLFTVPDAAYVLEQEDGKPSRLTKSEPARETWSQGIARLCADGYLDRGRVIDACLDAFTRDFNPIRVGWYATSLSELNLSAAEMAERQQNYLGLLSANSKTGVAVGQEGARILLESGQLDPGQLLAASAGALLFPQKNIATAQLRLIAAVAKKYPALRPDAAAAAAVAFGHQRQDIQEAALKLIGTIGVPDEPRLAEIRMRAMDLSASLAAGAVALGLLPDLSADQLEQDFARASTGAEVADELGELEDRIGTLPPGPRRELYAALDIVRGGDVPGPAQVRPAAGQQLPPPVTDPEELIQLLTMLIEDATDAVQAERALAGAVRLSSLPRRQRRQLAAPLLKRAEHVIQLYSFFYGDLITSDLAIIASVWAGEDVPSDNGPREQRWHVSGHFAVDSTGRALTMAGIFSARAWEAARIIASGQGGTLLAEPETDRGTITADTLGQRIRELDSHARGRAATPRYDREQALLRLAPGAEDAELWGDWARVAGQPADALRESHRVVQSAVRFVGVTGEPEGEPIRHSHRWHTHLLARTSEQIPAAPACQSWQLLTALADPLRDHVILYGPSRYELRHYDAAVAGWTLICPWQPEIAAAHLLRPLSDGLITGITPATIAMTSMRHPGHALGPVGHLALVTGLSSAEADTRIAAAELWTAAAADGRLDPALAAAAIVTGVRGNALKLSRIAQAMEHVTHNELAARRVVDTICAVVAELPLGTANMHMLVELAARLGTRTGVPELPVAVREMASKRGSSRISTTARQLVAAASSDTAGRSRAAIQALTALITRAEAGR